MTDNKEKEQNIRNIDFQVCDAYTLNPTRTIVLSCIAQKHLTNIKDSIK